MDYIYSLSNKKMRNISAKFKRYIYDAIDFNDRLVGITGARGVGKTTLMLQSVKERNIAEDSLYLSLDDLFFSSHTLSEVAIDFAQKGGRYLFIDEVHKYPGWSQEIKNLYDNYPELKIVFTGSSIIQVFKGKGDLSRRAVFYQVPNMSFREYLELENKIKIPVVPLKEILSNHSSIALDISSKIKPLKYFGEYLSYGAHPFYIENKSTFKEKLRQTVNIILENDLPSVLQIDNMSLIRKIHKYKNATKAPRH